MFTKLTLLYLVAISSPLVWADAGSGDSSPAEQSAGSSNDQGKQSIFPHLPFFPDFSSLLQTFQGLGSSGFQFPGLGGSRQERSAENEEDDGADHQSRFFFSLFPSIVGCNYTANPGRSCQTCTRALTCLRNNIGFQRNCVGLFRYCNNGRCSLTQSTTCASTAAPPAATTAPPAATTAPPAATTAPPAATAAPTMSG